MQEINVKNIKKLDELDSIRDIWIDIEKCDLTSTVFQSWDWNRLWLEQMINKHNKYSLEIKVFEDTSGEVVAIAPFFNQKCLGGMINLTQFIGHKMSFHNNILLRNSSNHTLTKKIIKALIKDLKAGNILHLRHLDSESTFTKELKDLGLAEPMCTRLYTEADPNITDQHMRLGKSRRKSFRLSENRLRKQFGMEYLLCSERDKFISALDTLIELHQKRFTSANKSTLIEGNNLLFFKSSAIALNNKGNCEILQLLAGRIIIASILLVKDRDKYFFIQSGFDPEYSRFSPMRLLLTESMRRGFDELGCKRFDFGPGYDSYKYDWSPTTGYNYHSCIGKNDLYSRTAATLYNKVFTYMLPNSHKTI